MPVALTSCPLAAVPQAPRDGGMMARPRQLGLGHGSPSPRLALHRRGAGARRCVVAAAAGGGEEAGPLKSELLALLGDGGSGEQRMARSGDRKRVEELVAALQEIGPPMSNPIGSPALLGRWQLLTTFKPGTADVDFFSPASWQKYLFEKGPSPVQSLVVGKSDVSNVFQILEDPANAGSKWQNVVEFGEGNSLVIEAELEGVRDEQSFFYRFSGGFFKLGSGMTLPYPVPFDVLEKVRPGQTRGWFDCGYLDDELRISTGDKGSVFVLRRPAGDANAAATPLIK